MPTGQTTPVCNIYDMGGNVCSWSTETHSGSNCPCTLRGGIYYNSYGYSSAGSRGYDTDRAHVGIGFRIALFL